MDHKLNNLEWSWMFLTIQERYDEIISLRDNYHLNFFIKSTLSDTVSIRITCPRERLFRSIIYQFLVYKFVCNTKESNSLENMNGRGEVLDN